MPTNAAGHHTHRAAYMGKMCFLVEQNQLTATPAKLQVDGVVGFLVGDALHNLNVCLLENEWLDTGLLTS